MPKVIGYTYTATCHCPACTKIDVARGRLVVNNNHPHALPLALPGVELDENGIHFNNVDREGNRIMPMFDTDEVEGQQSCDSCHDIIREDPELEVQRWKDGRQKRNEDNALRLQMNHPYNGRFV